MSIRGACGRILQWVVLALGCLAGPTVWAVDDSLAARVVIVANSDDPDSVRIAQHYAAVRNVPAQNLIALPMSLAEAVTWREFVAQIWTPLLERLVAAKWIDAIPMALTDGVGRPKFAPYSHRIAALVVCRGVPLKVEHDPALAAEVLPFTRRGEFRTNAGCVDAELSLLALPNYPINAFVPNPLFQNDHPSGPELIQVVKVSRLDGPTVEDALALVDRAVAAERAGLLGRAYVDLGRNDDVGDRWFEETARELAALHFDLSVDRGPGTFAAAARFDAPVLYFGWYSSNLDGPFALPGFRFPPGAIALHLHSFSAASLRTTTAGWTGPFVARGVTATVGNVHEPYLQLTHQPHLLLRALARGDTLVDAAYYALNALSWQAVLIGDPLYRPFAVTPEEQLRQRAQLPPRLAGYAVLRHMQELDTEGRGGDAIAFGIASQRTAPDLAVAVGLAERLRSAGNVEAAANALGFAPALPDPATTEWALWARAAQLLEACGRSTRATELWTRLLAIAAMPRELRQAWLGDAAKAAAKAGNAVLARAWEAEANDSASGKR